MYRVPTREAPEPDGTVLAGGGEPRPVGGECDRPDSVLHPTLGETDTRHQVADVVTQRVRPVPMTAEGGNRAARSPRPGR